MAKKTIQIVLLSTCETYYNNSHFRTNYNQLLSLKELEISIAKKKSKLLNCLLSGSCFPVIFVLANLIPIKIFKKLLGRNRK